MPPESVGPVPTKLEADRVHPFRPSKVWTVWSKGWTWDVRLGHEACPLRLAISQGIDLDDGWKELGIEVTERVRVQFPEYDDAVTEHQHP